MTHADYRLERLRAEIDLKRATLIELRGVLFKLQTELGTFAEEYDKKVGRFVADLEDVQREIRAVQKAIRAREETIFGPGIVSFDEYLESKRKSPNEPIKPIKPPVDESEVRTVYRKLARQYHPDTTTDPEEKARLSAVMARINAAYGAGDIKALRALENKPVSQVLSAIPHDATTYEELMDLSYKLDDEIAWTKDEHKSLVNGFMSTLKVECSIMRGKGRDLLREMAAQIQEQLGEARATLDALRRGQQGGNPPG